MKRFIYISSIILSLFALSCNNDDNSTEVSTATVQLTFDNRISATQDVNLGTTTFTNQNNESVVTNEFKYIVSNISLTKDDGTVFEYPKAASYFVINEADSGSLTINLNEIPVGNYTHISFGIGVDQSEYPLDGLLNFVPTAEEAQMIWNWAAGYIFIKFEGNYTPQNGTEAPFVIHVGSHGQTLDNYKFITLPLENTTNVSTGNTATITVQTYIEKILDATHSIKLEDTNNIQVDPVNAPKIANNLEAAFSAQ